MCSRDPFGQATIVPRTGTWGSDRGRAIKYAAAGTIYNLTISGETGYTAHIHTLYINHSGRYEYVCGNTRLPGAPVLWSNNNIKVRAR